jgi:DNA-binding transcriptional MocR family regulator
MAVAEFLDSGGYERHLRRLRRILASRVEQVRETVAASFPAGTRVTSPLGGFVLWVELPPAVDALVMQERAYERGVAIAPGPIFSARGRFGNFVRLSCGAYSPRVEAGVMAVGEIACELSGKGPER